MDFEDIETRYMMAKTARHMTAGNISSNVPSLCQVYGETADSYIGSWVFGLGLIDVVFPKSSTRELNEEEKRKYDGSGVRIGSSYAYTIKI